MTNSPVDAPADIARPFMTVPLLDLQAQYAPLRDELLQAITRVCDSQRFILGPDVDALERELAGLVGAAHAIGVSSGTDALLASLMAIDIGPSDEVITPAYSFFATAGCVARLGARPVMVDIDPVTYTIDPEAVARALSPRTRAIVPVHLFGLAADLDPMLRMADAHGVAVIEDAAQAIGAGYRGRMVGALGTAGCLSFYPTKNLGAFGDAGLVVTNDPALARTIRRLRDHGAEPKYFHRVIGGNFRVDALQAAVLRVKAPHVQRWSAGRRENAARYAALFAGVRLDAILTLPVAPPDRQHIFNQYVVRTPRRDELRAHLASRGIGTEIYYPVPLHLQECFAPLGYTPGDFPHAEQASRETLALPIYAELTPGQQHHVVAAIAEFFERR